MTIPTLHQNITQKVTVARLQKFHSTMESAFRLAIAENGSPENWDLAAEVSPQGALNVMNNISPYLNLIKNCGNDTGCFANSYKRLNGTIRDPVDDNEIYAKAQFADGTSFLIRISSPDCSLVGGTSRALQHICGEVMTDIDGLKGKNRQGVDLFKFFFTKEGIIPRGTKEETIAIFESNCQNTTQAGDACSAWVIYKGNMDYLTCRGSECDSLKW